MFKSNREEWSRDTHEIAGQALWYAWGRIDAGTPDTASMGPADMGFAFQDWYGGLAHEFGSDRAHFRPSIVNEWERFSSAGRVPADVFVFLEPTLLVPSKQDWRDHVDCKGFDAHSSQQGWHCYTHEIYNQP